MRTFVLAKRKTKPLGGYPMATTAINNNPGFCASLYESGRTGSKWVIENTKTLAASAGDFFGKVWAAVSEFFSSIGQTLGQWLNVAKETLLAAKDQFEALPRETKIAAGVALAVTTICGFAIGKCWGARAATPTAPANAANLQPQQPGANP